MATLMTNKLANDLSKDIVIFTGLLKDSKEIGFDDKCNIDVLPLDYSLLDDAKYKYPAGDNYFAYISRGCTNKCKFCAVPTLEPDFCLTNNITKQISRTAEKYGEKQNLLLLDNNILSLSIDELKAVVQDIKQLGFDKETKFFAPFPLTTNLLKLSNPNISKYAFENVLNDLVIYIDNKTCKKN